MIPGEKIEINNLDNLIQHHKAFLIRTISNFTGKYVSIENDEAYSIGLAAFAEAVERYEETRGSFLSFARLVIESRLKNNLRKVEKISTVSLEALQESGMDFADEEQDDSQEQLHEEILLYREELLKFGLTLEKLADVSPKHHDTRKTAVQTAEKASHDEPTVQETYQKKKLPIRRVARVAGVTEKIVKGSKQFILATMLIFIKKFPRLLYWIKELRCHHVS